MTMLSAETCTFLRDLKANNTREWFQANKPAYEAALKAPSAAFADAMAAALEAACGEPCTPKVFRIHRDVRFSKDKTPYNAHLHISFAPEGKPPAWMFGLEPDRLVLGVGTFQFDKAELDAYRARIDGPDGAALAETLAKLQADGVRLSDPDLKRVPAPYPADHPRGDLLRHKGLAAWIDDLDQSQAFADQGPARCTAALVRLKPVFDWLRG